MRRNITPVLKGATTAWASLATVVALAVGAAALSLSSSPSTAGADQARLTGSDSHASPPPAPRGWKAVSYDGVYVDVPVAWPVVDGMHTGFCDGPFPDTPTAFVGPNLNGAPSCGPPIGPPPVRYGVWLYPNSPTSDGPSFVTFNNRPVDEDLWLHGVLIEIGLGPDTQLVKEIVGSIGFKKGTPNTRASGVCGMQARPGVMPTPERLASPLVLEQGEVTLDPPLPSDESAVSAATVWNESGPKQPYERYRLILARYSATLPARKNANGSFTPLNHNELSWVVYAAPYSATIAGCGGWGMDVYDAHSGEQVISSGWAPGP